MVAKVDLDDKISAPIPFVKLAASDAQKDSTSRGETVQKGRFAKLKEVASDAQDILHQLEAKMNGLL